jgi:mRNA degradation ribonuclease J1/J2
VQLCFYGGVKEIGGNKILLEDGGTKILLDFGMCFKRRGLYFEEFLTPRSANGIGDFLTMKLIPDVSGFYREDLLEHFGRKPEEPDVAGVVLSHAHADHANYVSFLHKDIPVYCGETCKYILEAVEEQSQRTIENEVISFKKRPLLRSDYRKPPISRVFRTFRTGDRICIDSVEIEPIHVDHCLTGDTLVRLSDGELVKVEDAADICFVSSVDFKNGRVVDALGFKSRHRASRVFRIKTCLGDIRCTGEHRFFVLDSFGVVTRKAKDLKEGDFLIYFDETGFRCKQHGLIGRYKKESSRVGDKLTGFFKKREGGGCCIGVKERLLDAGFIFSPVESIDVLDDDPVVFDFEVPVYSNFLANGFLVHNSVPGSYGFIVHTTEGSVVYTGDLRMHGLHSDMTDDFIDAARESKPVAMITEGTRIDKGKTDESEQMIYRLSKKDILGCKGIVIVDFNFKDVDRFTTFYRLAKDLDRMLVISFRHACFLERYHRDRKLDVPDSTDDSILILKPKRLTGTYIDEDYTEKYIRDRLGYPNIVLAEDVRRNPLDYMVVLNFWYFNTLIDLKPMGGLYIHSLSEPFNEEMQISYDRMMNWLNFFNLKIEKRHCSGHISGPDLKGLIESINPKVLFPIHTEHPGVFRKLAMKTRMVKEGKLYKL